MDMDSGHDTAANDIDSYKRRVFGDAPFTYVDFHDREAADLATQRWLLLGALRPARQPVMTRPGADAVS
ncbi:MAG: hypothetical protein ACRETM_00395 [Stenotrophobium sp.]